MFPFFYSSEFYSFFVWGFSDCLMICSLLFCPDVYNGCILILLGLLILLLNIWYSP